MKYIIFDFFNDTRITSLLNFCEYFNLNFKDTLNYFNNADKETLGVNEIVKDLNIKLNMSYSSNVKIKCRHMTTSTEERLESFRKNGLLDLKRMLQLNTPLSKFLAKYEILVDVDSAIITIGNKKYPIISYKDNCPYCLSGKRDDICTGYLKCTLKSKLERLSSKLYQYGATVEYFMNSSLSNMQMYSTIDKYPEILLTISDICSCIPDSKMSEVSLGNEWFNETKKCYIIEFLAVLSDMETYVPIDYEDAYYTYETTFAVNGYDYYDYIDGKIPQNVLDNIMLIKWFIRIYFFDMKQLGSLLPNKYIEANDIVIIEVNNK